MLTFLIFFFLSLLCLEKMSLESSASSVLKRANLLTLIKTILDKNRNVSTKIVATTHEKSGAIVEVSGEKIWPIEGYFKNQMTDYDTEKVNYPQNSIFYVNQRNLIIKQKRKKCTMVTTF